MMGYTLSYSHYIYLGRDKCNVFKWVRINRSQLKAADVVFFISFPGHLRPGDIHDFVIEGTGKFDVLIQGDHSVRTLTSSEKNRYAQSKSEGE